MRTRVLALAVLGVCVFAGSAFGGGATKFQTAAADTIAASASDTLGTVDLTKGPAGFLMTWTGEDSASVVVQVTIDGTVWATFLSTGVVDRDTDFMIKRGLALDPMDGTGDVPPTVAIGAKGRAIITNEGSTNMTAIATYWTFQR